jgi:hypothetical protein
VFHLVLAQFVRPNDTKIKVAMTSEERDFGADTTALITEFSCFSPFVSLASEGLFTPSI